jgi:hypothetical protein
LSQGFSGNPAAGAFGDLLAGLGFDADEAVVGAAFASGLTTVRFAPAFADILVFADAATAFGLAPADSAFGLSGLAGFAAVLALAFAGVVLDAFATCPSLGRSSFLCLPIAPPPNDRDVLHGRAPRKSSMPLCIATIGDRASLAPAARGEEIFRASDKPKVAVPHHRSC